MQWFYCLLLVLGCFILVKSLEDNWIEIIKSDQYNLPDKNMDAFFSSREFRNLNKNFNLDISDFDFTNVNIEKFIEQGVDVYTNITVKSNQFVGKINIFSKNNGEKFRILFEDWSKFGSEKGGVITLYTSKKYFVANFTCERSDSLSNLFKVRLQRVADNSKKRLKTAKESPRDNDSWWGCLTDCYKMAKDACGDDPECDFLCELAGLSTGFTCFISMSTACAIWCI